MCVGGRGGCRSVKIIRGAVQRKRECGFATESCAVRLISWRRLGARAASFLPSVRPPATANHLEHCIRGILNKHDILVVCSRSRSRSKRKLKHFQYLYISIQSHYLTQLFTAAACPWPKPQSAPDQTCNRSRYAQKAWDEFDAISRLAMQCHISPV